MGYMVIASSEFSNITVNEFESFDDACEYAGRKHNLGHSVEVIKVAGKFIPRSEKVSFEEVV